MESVTPNAASVVAAENQFNKPPGDGLQFFLARVTFTYNGPEPSRPGSLELKAVGAANVIYSTYQNSCGVIPDKYDSLNEVFSGGTVTGNVCWAIRSGDAPSLVMIVQKSFGSNNSLFMALH